jgi:Uncharacterized protein conserved in bacteria
MQRITYGYPPGYPVRRGGHTRNITNSELERLFLQNLQQIVEALTLHDFVEIDRKMLTIHI